MLPPLKFANGRYWKSLNEATPRRICLGRITGAHGLKGDVKAQLAVDDLETLAAMQSLEVDSVSYQILAARLQKNYFILNLAGVQTREAAEQLVDQDIWIQISRLPSLAAGEYYWFEILDLDVFQADTGDYVGKVKAIMPTPAHDIYVVQSKTAEYFIPAVAGVVLSIDPEAGRLLIAPEGLAAQSGAY